MATLAENEDHLMEDQLIDEPDEDPPGHGVVVIIAVFFEVGLAPFSLILGWLLGHQPLATFVWSLRDAMWGVAAAFPPLALVYLMLRWPLGPLARAKEFCEQEIVPLFDESYWSELALIALSTGVGEEMLFRGVVQASLADGVGSFWAVVLASIIFGMLHPVSISYIIYTGLLGFYLGTI